MKIALFGNGAIAAEHVDAFRAIGDTGEEPVEIASVYAPRPGAAEAFARQHGIPRFATSIDEILQDAQIEAVVICSPSALHAPQARAALMAGKNVLCEIPLVLALDDAMALREVAREQHRVLMVAHTLRFDPALREIRNRIARDALDPHAIVARYHLLRRENTGWTGRKRTWTDNLLWHHGGHAVDTVVWMLGSGEVTATGLAAPPSGESGARLDAGIVVRTGSGVIGTISLSYNSAIAVHDYTIIAGESTFQAAPGLLRDARGVPIVTAGADRRAIVIQNLAFANALRGNTDELVDVDAILPSLRALQAIAGVGDWYPTGEERMLANGEMSLLDSRRGL